MTDSAGNLRQLHLAVGLYALENKGYPPFEINSSEVPHERTWHLALAPFLDINTNNWASSVGRPPVGVYNNPAVNAVTRSGNMADYGINNRLTGHHSNQGRFNLSMVTEPNRTFLFGETHACDRAIRDGWLTMSALHPGGTVQVVYVDGSVAALQPSVIYSQNNQNRSPWGWDGRATMQPQLIP